MLNNVAVGQPHVAAHNAERSKINKIASAANYIPKRSYTGPVSTDAPTITTGVAGDGAFNETYSISSNTLPAVWPIESWGKMTISANTIMGRTSMGATVSSVVTHRMMFDGSELMFLTYATGTWIDLFIDGQPYASNPIAPVATSGLAPYGFQKFVFASAKPRLLEFRMVGGFAGVYTKRPYRIWKPAPDPNPKIAVVGDSHVQPSVLSNTAASAASGDAYLQGIYQRMPAVLGIPHLTSDGLGGSGYLQPGPYNMNYGHATRLAWLSELQPDVVVYHGGGANDLINGFSVSAIITAATDLFVEVQELLPKAKLVFNEGIAPPGLTPGTYNPNYVAISSGVRSNLASSGVDAYFLDLATTRPPLNGTGYVTAPASNGNSDIYVGHDQIHLSVAGNTYMRHVIAPKLTRVLADTGDLVGQLVV